MNSNYREINAAQALEDPDSILNYYRKLIALRKRHKVIVYGAYQLLVPLHPEIYAYTRTLDDVKLLVILNFFGRTPTFEVPNGAAAGKWKLLISNYPVNDEQVAGSIRLQPYEARMYILS